MFLVSVCEFRLHVQIVDDLSNLDSRRREFKHIKELFVPSADEDEDEDEDE